MASTIRASCHAEVAFRAPVRCGRFESIGPSFTLFYARKSRPNLSSSPPTSESPTEITPHLHSRERIGRHDAAAAFVSLFVI